MSYNFAFQLPFFFLFVYFCFEAAKFCECSALGSGFEAGGWGGVGNKLRLGNDLLSTVKMALEGGICKTWEGEGIL